MSTARKIVYTVLCVLTVVIMLISVLSVFSNTPNNYMKMLDFPRIQWFIASAITMVLFIALTKHWRWYDYALVAGLLGGMTINASYLIHYTPLFPKRVADAPAGHATEDRISLLLANVLMDNRNAEPVLALIKEKKPDFFIAMEVDGWWDEQLAEIAKSYPYVREEPNDVAYGMALYSKFPLENIKVNRLNNKKVPSFETTVILPGNRPIVLHSVHPVPPKSFEKYPDNQGEQEVALRKVGQKVATSNYPSIIAGDLNDVVWGYTDRLTETENLLHDVRVGRGFYNSFNVNKWFMRWPIDHVFVTDHFALHKLERLGDIGSDHYPIYTELVLLND